MKLVIQHNGDFYFWEIIAADLTILFSMSEQRILSMAVQFFLMKTTNNNKYRGCYIPDMII